jgi:hypothetical protein
VSARGLGSVYVQEDGEAMRLHSFARIAAAAVVLAVLALSGGSATATAQSPRAHRLEPPFGPVHWWRADGTPRDVVGADNGRPLRGADYGVGVRGPGDQAFRFNAKGAEYRFNDRGGNFGRRDFTLAFFIKTSSKALQAIWEKWLVCGASSFWEFRMNGPGAPAPHGAVGLELMADQLGHDVTPNFIGTTPINDGAWHHVALARHGRTASLYIDGVVEATATTPRPVDLWNDKPLRAGASVCDGIDGTRSLRGKLDELMIFKRALTKTQIQALIAYLKGGTP